MTKSQMTEAILNAKKVKALTWTEIAAALGKTDVWVASCAYGENTMPGEVATTFCNLLDLGAEVHAALLEYPVKGNSLEGKAVPTGSTPLPLLRDLVRLRALDEGRDPREVRRRDHERRRLHARHRQGERS